jgi:hypothetical protein
MCSSALGESCYLDVGKQASLLCPYPESPPDMEVYSDMAHHVDHLDERPNRENCPVFSLIVQSTP